MIWHAVLWALAALAYTESLVLTPLTRSEVLSEFVFGMAQPISNPSVVEYSEFPRTLGQILQLSETEEMHLRFGQGWWDAERWGPLPQSGSYSGGIGVEVWAWVRGAYPEMANRNWHKLVHSLGGYFCASINFVDDTKTSWPEPQVLQPRGDVGTQSWLLRGMLPAEPICTENLTPLLKLLPCKGTAGVASLLDGHTLFNALWQTMSVDVWHTGSEVHLEQRISSVADTERCAPNELPFAKPASELNCDESKPWANDWTCFPVAKEDTKFSLASLFGRNIQGRCPVASESFVSVVAPANWKVNGSSNSRRFDLETNKPLALTFDSSSASMVEVHTSPLISMDRSFSGWGQQKGGIRTVVVNDGDTPVRTTYFETLPWFMRLYLHTTQLRGNGTLVNTRYVPSIDRKRPSQLEFTIYLPAGSSLEIEYDFDKSLLYLEEYPPDANHGFEVPPGLVIAESVDGKHRYEARTSSLLLSLPVPDFSMPYNVIILTSTVMALAFGSIYNLLDRKVAHEKDVPKKKGVYLLNRFNK